MKIDIGTFQHAKLPIHWPAAAGTEIIVESEGQSFEFRRRRAGTAVLGCMTGRSKLGKLRKGPAISLDEWGTLAR